MRAQLPVIPAKESDDDPDDVPRVVPSRRDKRALARKLRRLPAPRTGRPWPLVRKTGWPAWKYDALRKDLEALGIKVAATLPEELRGEQAA